MCHHRQERCATFTVWPVDRALHASCVGDAGAAPRGGVGVGGADGGKWTAGREVNPISRKAQTSIGRHSMYAIHCHTCLHWGGFGGQCRHIWYTWSVWDRQDAHLYLMCDISGSGCLRLSNRREPSNHLVFRVCSNGFSKHSRCPASAVLLSWKPILLHFIFKDVPRFLFVYRDTS